MKSFIAAVLIFSTFQAHADPAFSNLSDMDFENISKELSANFTHNSMMGASKLGNLTGFQIGLTGAQTASPKTNDIVKQNGGSDLPNLYNAGLMGVLGVPFGLSAEVVVMPQITTSGATLSSNSFGLKWNINEVIPVLPINLALRGIYSTSLFSFNQTISGSQAKVEDKNKVSGAQLLISPMFPIIEPYAGVGILSATNDLSVTGTSGNIFAPGYTSAQSASKNLTSTQFILGVEGSLLLLKIGAEYSQAFGTSRYGLKLAFGF